MSSSHVNLGHVIRQWKDRMSFTWKLGVVFSFSSMKTLPHSTVRSRYHICNFSKFPPADRWVQWEFSLKSMSPRFHTSKSLNWNLYFCTGTCISVLGHIFLFRNIYFLYWNIHISVLEYSYFCTGIHIFVLEYTFLYWNTYFCTGT